MQTESFFLFVQGIQLITIILKVTDTLLY